MRVEIKYSEQGRWDLIVTAENHLEWAALSHYLSGTNSNPPTYVLAYPEPK